MCFDAFGCEFTAWLLRHVYWRIWILVTMKIGIAQLNNIVGDLSGNAEAIVSAYNQSVAKGAEIVITPELSLTGYPPRNLVFKSAIVFGDGIYK